MSRDQLTWTARGYIQVLWLFNIGGVFRGVGDALRIVSSAVCMTVRSIHSLCCCKERKTGKRCKRSRHARYLYFFIKKVVMLREVVWASCKKRECMNRRMGGGSQINLCPQIQFSPRPVCAFSVWAACSGSSFFSWMGEFSSRRCTINHQWYHKLQVNYATCKGLSYQGLSFHT